MVRMRWSVVVAIVAVSAVRAETGRDAWLRYAPVAYRDIPAVVTVLDKSEVSLSAQREVIRGVRGMLGRVLREAPVVPRESAIVLGTEETIRKSFPEWRGDALKEDAYALRTIRRGSTRFLVVAGGNDRGVLYGAFHLLRKIAVGEAIDALDERQTPYAPVRWVNQWDNLDGSIERGYGGRSIFWDAGHARTDLTRVAEYGRLLASVGINGCAINNVNANPMVLTPAFVPEVARIAEALRPWGVRVAVSVDFGSPKSVGGLDSFDPLDPRVQAWWKARADDLYKAIPDFGGFVLKADSEGRVGPSTYGRSHADAANVVARALAPHGGLIFYRGFVYDHHMDWQNPKNDRARAAFDNFQPLDGKFDSNVVVQIKNGPIDFQVREPASPLFGELKQTNEAIELQITQEYMGQARHTVFLPTMWKSTLDFDLQARGAGTPVKALAAGKTFGRPTGGFVGVANVGLDENWFGNEMSQANLYGFGRLAWNPDLSARAIAEEWTRLTFGGNADVVRTIADIQMSSWRTYENYTGPLGLQTLTDITGNHYGVNVEASERNGWGQWHRADAHGVGMDRTVASGTGYVGQYKPGVSKVFEAAASCPDDLLLFMHHVPYAHVLHDGKTVIQYIYDSHYEGAAAVRQYVKDWAALKGLVDDARYGEVLAQLEYQAGQARVWRDAVPEWFLRESKIADAKGRVGKYPGRMEAEAMRLSGYEAVPVTPWEAASGGKAVECAQARCVASFRYDGPAGWRDIRVQYFDTNNGVARYRAFVGDQVIDAWEADGKFPTQKLDGGSSNTRTIGGVALRPGDEIRIEGVPNEKEAAGLDYVEVVD
jgi:alpha-glucuronidase